MIDDVVIDVLSLTKRITDPLESLEVHKSSLPAAVGLEQTLHEANQALFVERLLVSLGHLHILILHR